MAMTVGELVAYIRADNSSYRRTLNQSENQLQRFQRDANGRLRDLRGRYASEGRQAGQGFARNLMEGLNKTRGGKFLSNMLTALRKKTVDGLKGLAQIGLKFSAIGSTAVAALPLIKGAGLALLKAGQVAAGAAPALLAMGVAVGVVGFALKKLAPAVKWGLKPVSDALDRATLHASRLATGGVRPLVTAFANANFPAISSFMDRIGLAVQHVQVGFLRWGKSTAGVKAIKGILDPIGKSVTKIAPAVMRAAIAFTSMLGRIMGVSTAVGTKGLTGLLDRLTKKFDSITKSSVSTSFTKIASAAKAAGNVISTLVTWVKRAYDAYRTYQTQFGLVADALGIAAIAFGGPVGAIAGAVGLIIRHWGDLKRAYAAVVAYFTKSPKGIGFIDNLKQAAATVAPAIQRAFTTIKDTILPVLTQIGTQVTQRFIPALGELIRALAPIVAFLIDRFAPVAAAAFKNTLTVISGFLDWITGAIKVWTGVLSGDWSKVWSGLQDIMSGVAKVILGIVGHLMIQLVMLPSTLAKIGWNAGVGLVKGILNGFKRHKENLAGGIAAAVAGAAQAAGLALQQSAANAAAAADAAIADAKGKSTTPPIPSVPSYGGSGYTPSTGGAGADKKKAISAAEQKKRMRKLGQDLVKSLADGMSTSTDKIKAWADKTRERIKKAFDGFASKTKLDDQLLARLKKVTAKALALAKQYAKNKARIEAMQDFGRTVTSDARSFAGLTSLDYGDKAPTGEGIRIGLQGKLSQLKTFAANIKKLIKRHVPRSLLRQIMEAGPEAGGPLAAALAGSTDGTLSGISQAQREIDQISKDLGNIGIDAAFGVGALKGLQAQQKQIESLLDRIAQSFAKSIAKALGVKLPKQPINVGAGNAFRGGSGAPGPQKVQLELSLVGGSRTQLRETRKGLRIVGGNAVIVGGV